MASILVVNDIPGTGQVAGLTNLAVLNAAGHEVTLLPTVYLTHHTGRWPVYRESLDAAFGASLVAWKATDFRAIITGYFGNAQQIRQFVHWYQTYQADTYLLVDPIMGDRGQLYTGLDQAYVAAMQELVAQADLALPNLTEAYLLAGLDPSVLTNQSDQEALAPILARHQAHWVITGVEADDQIGVVYGDGHYVSTPRQPRHLFGTGDFFSSCFLAKQLAEPNLARTCAWCVDLVGQAAASTQPAGRQEVYYQPYLPLISQDLRQHP